MWNLKDHDVWTNIFYIAPAFFVFFDYFASGVVFVAGACLAIGSGAFHIDESVRKTRRLDIAAMFGFISSLPSALMIPEHPLFALVVPIVFGIYYKIKWKITARYHFIAWILIALSVLFYKTGWISLITLIPISIAIWIRSMDEDENSVYHSLWHVATQVSAITYFLVASYYI